MIRQKLLALSIAVVTAATMLGIGSACSIAPEIEDHSVPSPALSDPGTIIRSIATSVRPDGAYRDPDEVERSLARTAIKKLLAHPSDTGGFAEAFGQLGFEVSTGQDPETSRAYVLILASKERSWGALLVDVSAQLDLLVEVPHPGFDIHTELVGIELFRARPGSALLVAGAHRHAAGGLGDPAHNDKSLFHTFATTLAAGGLAELQLHGFADANLPGAEMVVSTGAAPTRALAGRIGDRLTAHGFAVCVAWRAHCGRLEGTRNMQGQEAMRALTVFVHLEISWSVRGDANARRELIRVLSAATSKAGSVEAS